MKILQFMKKFGLAILSGFFFLFGLGGFAAGYPLASICTVLLGLLTLPINLWQNLLTNVFKMSKWIKVGVGALLLVFFIVFLGMAEEAPEAGDSTQTSSIEQIIVDESSSETSESVPESSSEAEKPSSSSSSIQEVPVEPSSGSGSISSSSSVDSSSESKSEAPAKPVKEELPANSTFSIRFINVGQADAALVECDGEYMLIDGGNADDSDKMYSILKSAGASRLKLLVGTHAHEDHIGGLAGALNYATADVTLCPTTSYDSKAFNNFKKYADQNGGGITVPSVGDEYKVGSSTVTIVGVNGGSSVNDSSIILKIEYGKTSFLFAGDAEWEAENSATYSGYDLSADVLKVGHHGSDTSTGYVFLRSVAPDYAVISCGKGNSYGHPHEASLSRLRDADVKVFRTDLQGDIYCSSDGETVTFSVDKNADADTLAPGTVPSSSSSSVAPTPPPVSSSSEAEDGGDVYDFVLNKNSKKFHYDWCGSVKKMKDSNKKFVTGTRNEVIAMGYDPCNNCNP